MYGQGSFLNAKRLLHGSTSAVKARTDKFGGFMQQSS